MPDAPTPAPQDDADARITLSESERSTPVNRWLDRLKISTPQISLEPLSESLTTAWETLGNWPRQIPSPKLVQSLLEQLIGWFRVDESRVAEILQQVRSELPTTEAILIGKPQAGKSSIVRGLTGVSPDIIGQGFRPHTQHTQRYTYPTDDLPLLQFTDTVGLGDGQQETSEVIQELLGELNPDAPTDPATPRPTAAKVILLTIRLGDFATDTLHQIAQQIRQRHPEVPCLLVVTCSHLRYPPTIAAHPAYPPEFLEVQRAFQQIQTDFQGLFDRAVLIDFTLEEDGFDPVFYGLDALAEQLADLLPEAESRTIAQLLDDRGASDQIGQLYREVAQRYIVSFSIVAGTLAAVPLPLATMPVLTAVQISMVGLLGQLYGQTLSISQAAGLVSTLAGGFLAQTIGRELVKFIPGLGSVVAASWATAYTWALGEAACVYFGDLLGGKKPDAARIQAAMKTAFAEAKERFKSLPRS